MLNPDLYFSLVRRFGEVRVSNEGESMIVKKIYDYEKKNGTMKDLIVDSGEQYRVNCPHCGDRRFRLYVSYRWNSIGEDGQIFGRHLIQCFNEGCELHDFADELQIYIHKRPRTASLSEHQVQVVLWKDMVFPGTCVPINSLPSSHRAIQYLYGRSFDPEQLYKDWNVHFCVEAPDDGTEDCLIPGTEIHARLVRERIIIPVYREGTMVGWQARTLEKDDNVKYYTSPGFRKSAWLLNYDRARRYKFGIIVEGFFDAARIGVNTVVAFGHKISYLQRCLISDAWKEGGVAFMLDPDAMEDMLKLQKLVNPSSFKNGMMIVVVPAKDPGEMPTNVVWSYIYDYARTNGIKIEF